MQAKSKILLVEDNELNRDMLSRRIVRRGCEITMAIDGREALDRAVSNSPDLIPIDLSLPEIDGWETTRRLKAHNSFTICLQSDFENGCRNLLQFRLLRFSQ